MWSSLGQKMVLWAWKIAKFTRSKNEFRINTSLKNKQNIDFAVVATYQIISPNVKLLFNYVDNVHPCWVYELRMF